MQLDITVMPDPPDWDGPLPVGVTDCGTFFALTIGGVDHGARVTIHVHTSQQARALLNAAVIIRDGLDVRKGNGSELPLHA